MKKISDTELKAIIYKHAKWVRGENGGDRAKLRGADLCNANLHDADLRDADLCNANLYGANLYGANLRSANLRGANLRSADLRIANLYGANLYGANLRSANLRGANLYGADLRIANLRGANLYGADLRIANLRDADLRDADLCNANLYGANLYGADLRSANLRGANLRSADLRDVDLRNAKIADEVKWDMYTTFYPLQCPETGSFIGYKKASGHIVELEICADAKRSSATSRKCRCSKAKVLGITNLGGSASGLSEIGSDYNKNFIYRIGETVEVPDFDDNRWNECATGIHFFITREEAVKYN